MKNYKRLCNAIKAAERMTKSDRKPRVIILYKAWNFYQIFPAGYPLETIPYKWEYAALVWRGIPSKTLGECLTASMEARGYNQKFFIEAFCEGVRCA